MKQTHVTRQKTDWRINWKPSIIYHQKKARENWGNKGEPLSSCTPCSCRTAAGTCSCPGWSPDLETRHIIRDFIKYTRNNRQLVSLITNKGSILPINMKREIPG